MVALQPGPSSIGATEFTPPGTPLLASPPDDAPALAPPDDAPALPQPDDAPALPTDELSANASGLLSAPKRKPKLTPLAPTRATETPTDRAVDGLAPDAEWPELAVTGADFGMSSGAVDELEYASVSEVASAAQPHERVCVRKSARASNPNARLRQPFRAIGRWSPRVRWSLRKSSRTSACTRYRAQLRTPRAHAHTRTHTRARARTQYCTHFHRTVCSGTRLCRHIE
jgi:hypothetical protein